MGKNMKVSNGQELPDYKKRLSAIAKNMETNALLVMPVGDVGWLWLDG
ncbi:MAG: hypothetical protein AAFO06_09010 [Cyanobacteria bacterium J06597_16]